MPIRVYNTLTQAKEPLQTVTPGKVGMYVCGPTVYSRSHIGHMVGPVIFDTIKRFLVYSGYDVTWVVNITDVDDKLIAQADADPRWGTPLINSLARGGEGTLIRRFTSGVATKRVRAKTGYLDGVSAMAGRVVSRRGVHYGFALLMNTADIGGARAVQDNVVTLLAAGAED